MKLAIFAAALTLAATSAASAEPYSYGHGHDVDVYTGDLNLSDPRDREEAAYRVHLATQAACAPFPDIRVLQEYSDYQDCRGEAFHDAMSDLASQTKHQRRGHVRTREYPGDHPPPPEPSE